MGGRPEYSASRTQGTQSVKPRQSPKGQQQQASAPVCFTDAFHEQRHTSCDCVDILRVDAERLFENVCWGDAWQLKFDRVVFKPTTAGQGKEIRREKKGGGSFTDNQTQPNTTNKEANIINSSNNNNSNERYDSGTHQLLGCRPRPRRGLVAALIPLLFWGGQL